MRTTGRLEGLPALLILLTASRRAEPLSTPAGTLMLTLRTAHLPCLCTYRKGFSMVFPVPWQLSQLVTEENCPKGLLIHTYLPDPPHL